MYDISLNLHVEDQEGMVLFSQWFCYIYRELNVRAFVHLAFAFAMHLASIVSNGTRHLAMAAIGKHQNKSALTQMQTIGAQGP